MERMAEHSSVGLLCPVCRVDLVMADRQGVEVDYCPKCRGVWLDRGELDKIIERSAAYEMPPRAPEAPAPRDSDYRRERRDDHHRDEYGGDEYRGYGRRHKRKSFLGDLFDFD